MPRVSKKIHQFDLYGNLIRIWDSPTQVAKELKVSHGNIITCCQKKTRKVYDHVWIYDSDLSELNERLESANEERSSIAKKTWKDNKEKILEKSKQSNIKRFGVEHHMQLDTHKRFGSDNHATHASVKEKIRLTEIETKMTSLLDRFSEKLEFIKIISNDEIIFKGISCGHEFTINRQLLIVRDNNVHTICTVCNKPDANQKSEAEKAMFDFVKQYKEDAEMSSTVFDSRKQLDIYVPSIKFAIEHNGLRYHNSKYRPMNYHLDKTNECNTAGIRLLHIFEDEWLYKQDIVKSMIKNFMNCSIPIDARKCTIETLTHKEQFDFFEGNHLQGGVACEVCIGLKCENRIVSAMSFSKPRASLSKEYKDEIGVYELLRYCNIKDHNVRGGASRIMKSFIRKYNPNKIISYANRRWSNGGLYESLRFNYVWTTPPNYWYVKDNLRINRTNFEKRKLIKMGYDPNKSEKEIMEELDIPRIYDCGNLKYEWIKPI